MMESLASRSIQSRGAPPLRAGSEGRTRVRPFIPARSPIGSGRPAMVSRPGATSEAQASAQPSQSGWQPKEPTYICTSATAGTVAGMLAEIGEAEAAGADVVELRLDFLTDFDPAADLKRLLDACTKPCIFTYRPTWEGCARGVADAGSPKGPRGGGAWRAKDGMGAGRFPREQLPGVCLPGLRCWEESELPMLPGAVVSQLLCPSAGQFSACLGRAVCPDTPHYTHAQATRTKTYTRMHSHTHTGV
jgi:hypothetical protein